LTRMTDADGRTNERTARPPGRQGVASHPPPPLRFVCSRCGRAYATFNMLGQHARHCARLIHAARTRLAAYRAGRHGEGAIEPDGGADGGASGGAEKRRRDTAGDEGGLGRARRWGRRGGGVILAKLGRKADEVRVW
jgi:hypothetical protein